MFNSIQKYIIDSELDNKNEDFDEFKCRAILAEFKENFNESYEQIFDDVEYAINVSRVELGKPEMLIRSIIEDAMDYSHETLTNLITHYTNECIKEQLELIEEIRELAEESKLDAQQDIDGDNAQRARDLT